MSPKNELPPAELSLKYIAWSVKEMAECVKKITQALEELAYQRNAGHGKPNVGDGDAVPF